MSCHLLGPVSISLPIHLSSSPRGNCPAFLWAASWVWVHSRLTWESPDWDLVLLYLRPDGTKSQAPYSRLGTYAWWQRYAVALSVAPMSESWADSSGRVELMSRWSVLSARALSMITCKSSRFPNIVSDELTSPLSESSYATEFHHQDSPGLLPFSLIGEARLTFCSPLLMIPSDS